jgi:DNA primase
MSDDPDLFDPVAKPLPRKSQLEAWQEALFVNRKARHYRYLVDERGLSPKVLEFCRIGWDATEDAYVIPLFNERGQLENVKWWRAEWSDRCKKKGHKDMWVIKDRRSLTLFPTYKIEKARNGLVLIPEGEVDAMTLLTHGYAAVTPTGGAGKWDPTWGRLFADKDVVIVPDLDPSGRAHALAIQENLVHHARSLRILRWGDVL